ncbi:hypothetical protein SteCoe_19481 [Stentor coeruleus]|uniref:Uncharacterized protein n=1 Tax=Stentor coeruleus TaxID=5963 RepID=A0A1R2BTY8_9CILI|nr:hypothetical protein SteCoe_19481 [Stentor coeruleus]
MEDKLTCASDLDCSRGSESLYCKDIKTYMNYDIENIKKTYQKRKNIMRNYSISMNSNKPPNLFTLGSIDLRFRPDVIVSDTPVEKFVPKSRPKMSSKDT